MFFLSHNFEWRILFFSLLLKGGVIAHVLLLTPVALAESTNDVRWGGVWLRGSNAERKKNFPVGTEFAFNFETRDAGSINTQLITEMRAEAKPNGGRILDRLMANQDLASASFVN